MRHGVAVAGKAGFHANIRHRPAGHPVFHHPGNHVGHELRARRNHEFEGVPEAVAEHVVDRRQHGDPVQPALGQPLLQHDQYAVAAVADADLPGRRRHHHHVVQATPPRPLADPFAEADEELPLARFHHREGVGAGLDHVGRKAILGAAGRHLQLRARRESQEKRGAPPPGHAPGPSKDVNFSCNLVNWT